MSLIATVQGYFRNWKNIFSVSVGVAYLLFTLYVIFHIPQYFPANQQDHMYQVFIGYSILTTIMFANESIRNKLMNTSLISFLPRFLLFFVIGLVGFYFAMRSGAGITEPLFQILRGVPLYLALIYSATFALTEEAVFSGYLADKLGHPWSEVTAGLFHFGIWPGGLWSVVIAVSVLFGIFSLANHLFARNKSDLAPGAGLHTAYNMLSLGIMVAAGGIR